MATWMATIPRWIWRRPEYLKNEKLVENTPKSVLNFFKSFFEVWQFGVETGASGYEHYQARFCYGFNNDDETFNYLQEIFMDHLGPCHIEHAKTDKWEYEKKEGSYYCADDNPEKLLVRFCKLKPIQQQILDVVDQQNVRQVTVIVDYKGGNGKTVLAQQLWQHGKALLVPRYITRPKEVMEFIHSMYTNQEYIIIDIPRSKKLNDDQTLIIECVKDGIINDSRYQGREKYIRGTKVLVLTNKYVDKALLSSDRWAVFRVTESLTSPNGDARPVHIVTLTPALLR